LKAELAVAVGLETPALLPLVNDTLFEAATFSIRVTIKAIAEAVKAILKLAICRNLEER
jgi:hypothetical protein